MIRLLLLIGLLVSFSAVAQVEWNDLTAGNTYKVSEDISLENIKLEQGHELNLLETIPLDFINVMLFRFNDQSCTDNEIIADMQIILPQNNNEGSEVGVSYEECTVEIFVENKDLFMPSLLL